METDHVERPHAKYSGSNVSRFRRCNGQARYAKHLGRHWGDSVDAIEGTTVHELIEIAVEAACWPVEGLDHVELGIAAARKDWRYTDERAFAVSLVLGYIEKLRLQFPDLVVASEKQVFFPQSAVPADDCCGMADIVLYSPFAARGWLLDYKNGVRRVADPGENDQLWFYGTAAFWDTPLASLTLAIVQPNCYGTEPIREHTAPGYELIAFQSDLEAIIMRCEQPDVSLLAGDWCSQCGVGAECAEREREVVEIITGYEGDYMRLLSDEIAKPKDLDVQRWAAVRKRAKFVRDWLKDIDDAAFGFAMKGGKVPGEKLVTSSTTRKWDGTPEETADGLSALTGKPASAFLSTVVVGITEAEKALAVVCARAPNPASLKAKFEQLAIMTPSGKLSLVPETDKRPAFSAGADTFGGLIPAHLVGKTQ